MATSAVSNVMRPGDGGSAWGMVGTRNLDYL